MNIHKLKKTAALVLAAVILLCALPSYAYEGLPDKVRIGLFYDSTALSEASFTSDTEMIVYSGEAEIVRGYTIVLKGEGASVGVYINDQCVHVSEGDSLVITPTQSFININTKPYRGSFDVINLKNGKMTIVNVVPLEEYLYGVVPLEMSTGFPIEALKSQAICARTYAAKNVGRFASKGFDLTNTTLSQVYGGVSAEAADCTQAVDETKGLVLTYEGVPAETFYFSTSSGVTLNSQDVWYEKIPYLQSVEDSWQHLITPDNKAWEVTYTAAEVTERMVALGYDVGDVISVTADETNAQGAVMKLTVTGTKGSHTFTKEGCRNAFNLRSQVFTIISNGTSGGFTAISYDGMSTVGGGFFVKDSAGISQTDNLKVLTASGMVDVDTKTASDSFVMKGSGWGHGIGMSQNGAKGMAQSGFTCQQILTHYFSGTQIQ